MIKDNCKEFQFLVYLKVTFNNKLKSQFTPSFGFEICSELIC